MTDDGDCSKKRDPLDGRNCHGFSEQVEIRKESSFGQEGLKRYEEVLSVATQCIIESENCKLDPEL